MKKRFVIVAVMAGALLAGPQPASANWSCDGPPQAYVDDCNNYGECFMLNTYWSWYGQNCN